MPVSSRPMLEAERHASGGGCCRTASLPSCRLVRATGRTGKQLGGRSVGTTRLTSCRPLQGWLTVRIRRTCGWCKLHTQPGQGNGTDTNRQYVESLPFSSS